MNAYCVPRVGSAGCTVAGVAPLLLMLAGVLAGCGSTAPGTSAMQPGGIGSITPAMQQPAGAPAAPASGDRNPARVVRLVIQAWPLVLLDGRQHRAAPGARIMTRDGLSIIPDLVVPDTPVQAEFDALGQIRLLRIVDPSQPAPRGTASRP